MPCVSAVSFIQCLLYVFAVSDIIASHSAAVSSCAVWWEHLVETVVSSVYVVIGLLYFSA